MSNKETVNIRPSVGYLSILQAINYRAWYAIAEFVDNSLQSYIQNKPLLRKLHGSNYKLKIAIYVTKSKIQSECEMAHSCVLKRLPLSQT